MKKIFAFTLGLLMFASLSLFAQNTNGEKASGPEITFTEASFDFGDIKQGDQVEHTFNFKNTGTEPLILSNVLTTCGCTATDWPRDPIAPGKSGSITVKFNSAGKMGKQNKVVTIVSNASNAQERVKIITNVLPNSGKTDSNS